MQSKNEPTGKSEMTSPNKPIFSREELREVGRSIRDLVERGIIKLDPENSLLPIEDEKSGLPDQSNGSKNGRSPV